MDLKELESVDPHHHWYYQAKLRAIASNASHAGFVGGYIIDVGAGSGFFSSSLKSAYPGSRVLCVDPNYSGDQVHISQDIEFARAATDTQIGDASLFLFIDVLEHVSDDLALLTKYTRQASPGALVIVSVPAFMNLWSGHDVFLEHFRRYRRREVLALAESAGLDVHHSQYLFGTTFLPLWVLRKMPKSSLPASHMKAVPKPVNTALSTFFKIEHGLRWNPILGSTFLLVAKVPADAARSLTVSAATSDLLDNKQPLHFIATTSSESPELSPSAHQMKPDL